LVHAFVWVVVEVLLAHALIIEGYQQVSQWWY
jgi:hypothetical protein